MCRGAIDRAAPAAASAQLTGPCPASGRRADRAAPRPRPGGARRRRRSSSSVVALARPQASSACRARGHGDPRLRRLGQHGRDGPRARPGWRPRRPRRATFVERQPPGVVIGVVAFSDGGFAVQAPTNDQAAVLAAIDRLTPQRGTSLGQGILASLDAIAAAQQDTPADYYSNRSPEPTADADAGRRRAATPRRSSSCSPTARTPSGPTRRRPRRLAADRGHPDLHGRDRQRRRHRRSTSTGSRSTPSSTRRRSSRSPT